MIPLPSTALLAAEISLGCVSPPSKFLLDTDEDALRLVATASKVSEEFEIIWYRKEYRAIRRGIHAFELADLSTSIFLANPLLSPSFSLTKSSLLCYDVTGVLKKMSMIYRFSVLPRPESGCCIVEVSSTYVLSTTTTAAAAALLGVDDVATYFVELFDGL